MSKTRIKTYYNRFKVTNNKTTCQSTFSIPVNREICERLNLEKYNKGQTNVFFVKDEIYVITFGVARYKSGDVRDEVLAQRIAETKAQRKAFSIFERIYNDYADKVAELHNNVLNYIHNTAQSLETIEEHIKQLVSDDEK